MDAAHDHQVRDLIRAMHEARRRLEKTLADAQAAMPHVWITSKLGGQTDGSRRSHPAGPPELIDEAVTARALLAETYRIERYWKRAGIDVPEQPPP